MTFVSLNFLSFLIILNYQKMDRDTLARGVSLSCKHTFACITVNHFSPPTPFVLHESNRKYHLARKRRVAGEFYYLYSINITYSNMFIIDSVSIVLIGQKLFLLLRLFRLLLFTIWANTYYFFFSFPSSPFVPSRLE